VQLRCREVECAEVRDQVGVEVGAVAGADGDLQVPGGPPLLADVVDPTLSMKVIRPALWSAQDPSNRVLFLPCQQSSVRRARLRTEPLVKG
jgi:hypothetical protein